MPAAAAALDAIGERADSPGFAVDLGAGTGYQLARLLDALPGWRGLALDASTPALRRAARAHPRMAAVACDIWGELPLRDGAADLALNVFAPRSGGEIARVLAPDGVLIVVTPTASHLQRAGRLAGDAAAWTSEGRAGAGRLSSWLSSIARRELELPLALSRADVRRLVAMGPSARHVDPDELERGLAELPDPTTVTASVTIETFGLADA